jgi:hypothetical protein
VREQEARVHQVILSLQIVLHEIRQSEVDIYQTLFASFSACKRQLFRVNIGSDDLPAWPNHSSHIEGDISTATAKLQASHARSKTGTSQQLKGCRLHDAGENAEPLPSLNAAANDVA